MLAEKERTTQFSESTCSIRPCTWDDVRAEVMRVQPEMARAIDQISPGKEYILWKVRYPFGVNVVKNGELQIPTNDGNLICINDPNVNPKIKASLDCHVDIPPGVVLRGALELNVEVRDRIVPMRIMQPGRIFSLWSQLQDRGTSGDLCKTWSIYSGARSLFMLPKISQADSCKRIKKEFNLNFPNPGSLIDQWLLFRELAQSPDFGNEWYSELIFFPRQWVKQLNDPLWQSLERFLLKYAWEDTAHLRDQQLFNFSFSMALMEKNLRPNPYLKDTVKHLYNIGRGVYPAFKIATDDIVAPISRFQEIFDQLYEIKFAPTMVHPAYLKNGEEALYYSVEFPTVMEFSPKSRKASNKLNDLREIKHIQKVTSSYLSSDKFGFEGTPFYQLIAKVSYRYFHSDVDQYHEAELTSNLSEIDGVVKKEAQRFSNKPFCTSSVFLRGCIRIGFEENTSKT